MKELHNLPTASKWNAIGIIGFAIAIIIEIMGGASVYPTIPPGVLIAFAVAALVVYGYRYRWTTIVGVAFPIFLVVGGLLNLKNWLLLLTYPSLVVSATAVFQIISLIVALIAGIVAVMIAYKPKV